MENLFKNNLLYKILFLLTFVIIVVSFAWYSNSFCLSGDDIWILTEFQNLFKSSDHGNMLYGQIFYTLNVQLPELFNIHPQIFLTKVNIYLYGVILFVSSYFLTSSAYLFKKKDCYFPFLILIFTLLLFSLSMVFSRSYSYWFRESCTFIRYTVAILCMIVFWNLFIKSYFVLYKSRLINISLFLLGFLCANACEINALISAIVLFMLFLQQKILKNLKINFYSLLFSFIGIFLGGVAIIFNGGFKKTYDCEFKLNASISTLKNYFSIDFNDCYTLVIILVLLISILLLFILKKLYAKKLFTKIFSLTLYFFLSCNIFTILLTCIYARDSIHGDIKLVLAAVYLYIILLLYGLVIRKIKNKKNYNILAGSIIIFSILISPFIYKSVKADIQFIRNTNLNERNYLFYLEEELIKQYSNNKEINLKLDETNPFFYREYYVNNYIPKLHPEIDTSEYKINWIKINQ